ncbi:MAG: nitrate reductase molybdenum cofactor assembly chaperone [Deltaproteobacteria bacterium]|nr:nitrate reductase molybdenum cofactor assembly chaperone [Deltaproteobacteria bacterium]
MIDHPTDSLHVLSVLLHYPDEELFNRLDEISSVAEHSRPAEIWSAIQAFVNELNTHSLIQVQERYTAVFDIDPKTTMNMTWHAFGDNEKRAAALAHLQHNYEQAGWTRITGELPDYLPMMLEFLAICPHPEHTAAVWQCLQGMQLLVARLEKKAPVYADLLQPIVRMAAERGASVDNGSRPPQENA